MDYLLQDRDLLHYPDTHRPGYGPDALAFLPELLRPPYSEVIMVELLDLEETLGRKDLSPEERRLYKLWHEQAAKEADLVLHQHEISLLGGVRRPPSSG